MEQINHRSVRATESHRSRGALAVPNGWRKISPALTHAAQLADAGKDTAIDRNRAIVALKRVAPQIGLKAADVLLLDTLVAFSQPQDWQEGQQAIVWASNALLMERTGFSLSTLKRHSRRLVEIGVISFRDSPNGKRWGQRNHEGRIVEAYGFDLSPLALRAVAFEELSAQLTAERTECLRLKRQITVLRRTIRARLDEAGRGASALLEAFELLLERIPGVKAGSEILSDCANKLGALLKQLISLETTGENPVHILEEPPQNRTEVTPSEVKNDPHIQDTNQLKSVTYTRAVIAVDKPKDKQSNSAPIPAKKAVKEVPVSHDWLHDHSLPLKSCPEYSDWLQTLGCNLSDWQDVMQKSEVLRPMIGVQDSIWSDAKQKFGLPMAIAALALIFEKVQSGEVATPSGYLRGMIRKFDAQALHLDRSLFGRLRGQAA